MRTAALSSNHRKGSRTVTLTVAHATIAGLKAPTESAAILANVETILPIVDEEAVETNARAAITPHIVEALRAAGSFRVAFSRRRGGPEMSLTDQTRMVEMVARHDASIAWNVTVLAATGFYACRLGDEAFAQLYPHLDVPTCGSFHPRGRAEVVDGGFEVTGQWQWGSGIHGADRIVAGVDVFRDGEPVLGPAGKPLVLGVWLPREQVRIADNWKVIGLSGSGSAGYSVEQVFVPEQHTFDRYFAPDPAADPLNKHHDLPFYSMTGIELGIAQHAVDLARSSLAGRLMALGDGGVTPVMRQWLGEAEVYVRAARALTYDGMRRIDEKLFASGALPDDVELARGDAPLVTHFARHVVDLCTELVGSRFIYDEHPMSLLIRDITGVSAHISTTRKRWTEVGSASLAVAAAATS
jgi:alkylation response protein AidB-like acyl-CoA dehydrogenase